MTTSFRPARTPYGVSSYGTIREAGLAFVDKTRFIETLENLCGQNVFVARPRRFGKSVFATMLASCYDVREAPRFEVNFGGTYIAAHRTPLAGRLRVLEFDFSGLSSAPDLAREFKQQMTSALGRFADRHPFDGARELLKAPWTSAGS